jgi:hypothetical protein
MKKKHFKGEIMKNKNYEEILDRIIRRSIALENENVRNDSLTDSNLKDKLIEIIKEETGNVNEQNDD